MAIRIFKGLSKDGGGTYISENLLASPFKKKLCWTTFSPDPSLWTVPLKVVYKDNYRG
jgi:hypothetical protein